MVEVCIHTYIHTYIHIHLLRRAAEAAERIEAETAVNELAPGRLGRHRKHSPAPQSPIEFEEVVSARDR